MPDSAMFRTVHSQPAQQRIDRRTAPAASARPALRVLTFLHSWHPGGVERVALRLHSAWLAAGVDAHLLMGRDEGATRPEWPDLLPEFANSRGVPTGAFETLWMIACLPGVIRRLRPDVLFCAGSSYTVVAVAMKLLLGRDCPPIVAKISNDLHRLDMPAPIRPFYRLWLRVQGRMLDRIIGMAPPMANELTTLMRAPPARIAIIDDPSLDAADVARLAAARACAEQSHRAARRFIAVGRLAPQKNFALLLDAFALIARGNDRLVILGEGPLRGSLERRIQRLGLAGRVDMPGHVNPLDEEMLRADALVLSSDYEGVPAVVAEALAAGLPVVATACSASMDDMIGHGRFGCLVPTGDAAALAVAMDAAPSRPFDRNAARAQATRFTVQRAASRYVEELECAVRA